MSINWSLDADPAPALLVLPGAAASLDEAHAAIELWEHYSGKTLDPTQRLVVEVMMAETGDGKWAAATTGREMPRQNGKGDEIEVVELWGLVHRGEAILHTVHDAVLLASQAQQRMLSVLERPDLRQRVKRKWMGTGQQMIEMHNGGTIWYRTRTGGGGRGVDDIARLVIDEAQHATEEHLAAVAPTLLANENPQMNVLGTGGLEGKSEWWWSVRKRALTDAPGAFGYVGHTAEVVRLDPEGQVLQEPVDIGDRSLWWKANPALGSGRGQGIEFLEEQLLRLGAASFAREHLGVWDPPAGSGGGVITPDQWAELEGTEDHRPDPVVFTVAVAEDRSWSHIGIAGRRSDDSTHVQVVQSGRSTDWVAERVAELVEAWSPRAVALDPASPAGSLIPDLSQHGVSVETINGREVAQACGAFLDAVNQGSVHHGGQRQLNVSVGVARKKSTEGGAFVWQSADPKVDIAPLRAVTLALFVLEQQLALPKKRSGKAAFL